MPTSQRASHVPILMYHSISDQASARFRPFTVTPTMFEKQMAYLAGNGYTAITVSDLARSATSGRVGRRKQVVLTFDDGFADLYTQALPTLRRYGMVATVYIATTYVGGKSAWLRREAAAERPILTWEQLREISAGGIECGGHSHTHANLDLLPLERSYEGEIIRCKEILERYLEKEITTFAYPFGRFSPALTRSLRQAGFTSACAVGGAAFQEHDDLLALPRLAVRHETDIVAFERLLARRSSPVMRQLRCAWLALYPIPRRSLASLLRRFSKQHP